MAILALNLLSSSTSDIVPIQKAKAITQIDTISQYYLKQLNQQRQECIGNFTCVDNFFIVLNPTKNDTTIKITNLESKIYNTDNVPFELPFPWSVRISFKCYCSLGYYAGCSGWCDTPWKGPLYPTNLNPSTQDAAALGNTICCSSGDNGSSDSRPQNGGLSDILAHAHSLGPYPLAWVQYHDRRTGGERITKNYAILFYYCRNEWLYN